MQKMETLSEREKRRFSQVDGSDEEDFAGFEDGMERSLIFRQLYQ